MGSASSRSLSIPPTIPESEIDQNPTSIDAVVAVKSKSAGGKKHSTSSVPVTHKETLRITTKQMAPPIWDPRSPSAPRTPKKEVKQIRASMVAQQMLEKQLAELVNSEMDPRRRNTTQLNSIPSVRALMDKGRPLQSDSPKTAKPRIDLTESNPSVFVESSLKSPGPLPILPASTAAAPASGPRVSVTQPAGFASNAGSCLSPLSEFVEKEFVKGFDLSQSKRLSLQGGGATLPKLQVRPSISKIQQPQVELECKEEK